MFQVFTNVREINLDDMIPILGAACQYKLYRMNRSLSESVISVKQTDGTYFPPQKIFVVITRLERLKNKSRSLRTSVTRDLLHKPKK